MNETEFFDLLWKLVKHTDVDWEKAHIGDEKDGEIYVKFTNVTEEGDES
jgi:hypothetical protein